MPRKRNLIIGIFDIKPESCWEMTNHFCFTAVSDEILLFCTLPIQDLPMNRQSPLLLFLTTLVLIGHFAIPETSQAQSRRERITINPQDGLGDTSNTFGKEYQKQSATFRETQTTGAVLTGFVLNVSSRNARDTRILGILPIYQKGDKEIYGAAYGNMLVRTHMLVAKKGYAVGKLEVRSALELLSLKVVFMKVAGDHLDENDSYASDLAGADDNSWRKEVSTGGRLPVGLYGSENNKKLLHDFGLVVKMSDEDKPKKKK